MKKLLLALTLLCLTSCIPVDDFGAYWDKGTVDPAVVGAWKNVHHQKGASENVKVSAQKGAYRITSLAKKDKKDKPLFARTLTAGRYTFFMAASDEGGKTERDLVRYKVEGKTLTEYDLEVVPTETWLKWRHPEARNITARTCKPKCLYESVNIHTLDANVVNILAGIPDTAEYWHPMDEWRKVK